MNLPDNITILIAHPDDEILFLWPFLQSAKRIVCCVSDTDNMERQWCSRRGEALKEVGGLLGVEVINLGANSEFYRMETRRESLKRFCESVMAELRGPVATHNPWGEYGHIDHILCHHIARSAGLPIMTTNIAQQVNWLPIRPYLFGEPIGTAELDMDLFARCKAIYDSYGCWTWSQPPVTKCEVLAC